MLSFWFEKKLSILRKNYQQHQQTTSKIIHVSCIYRYQSFAISFVPNRILIGYTIWDNIFHLWVDRLFGNWLNSRGLERVTVHSVLKQGDQVYVTLVDLSWLFFHKIPEVLEVRTLRPFNDFVYSISLIFIFWYFKTEQQSFPMFNF